MDLGLKDKVVIVTGGGAGIGGAISRALAAEGAIPVIFARRAPDAGFLAGLQAQVSSCDWLQVELSKDDEVRAAVAATRDRWGQVYGLVNN
ncbi:MAG: SDR family NAD(P)-dependent oxidoreductase, partial [Pseudorhodobacter sp.]